MAYDYDFVFLLDAIAITSILAISLALVGIILYYAAAARKNKITGRNS
ncbi:hypothetical protein GF325_05660 [Candidatus Bathyarchaeota archaeon]|nr:hypothetical protein [Candidatus Bathyarchaeota archaeon]